MPFLIVGPSWGERSYDEIETQITTFQKVWTWNCLNLSKGGNSNISCYNLLKDYFYNYNHPIVYFMCEPVVDIECAEMQELKKEFITSKNFLEIRNNLLRSQLKQLDSLNLNIGIIGAHSDIRDSDIHGLTNLTILHNSYQTHIAKMANLTAKEYHVGYDVMHRIIFNSPDIRPSHELIDFCYDGLEYWQQFQNNNLFYNAHPNHKSLTSFAHSIQDKIKNFLPTKRKV